MYIKYREAIVSFCIVRRTNHEFFHVTLVATLLEAMQCTHGRFYLSVLTVLRSAFSSPHRSTWSYLFVGSFPPLFLSLSSFLSHDFFFLPCSLTSRSKSTFCQETFHAGKPLLSPSRAKCSKFRSTCFDLQSLEFN